MAKPRLICEPAPQLEVDSLKETGFVVPPGKYGFVNASGTMIIKKALVISHGDALPDGDTYDEPFKDGMDALRCLGAPDPDSRSQAFEGRRLVRIDGGYIVLNYNRFRDKDYTTTKRKRKQRERQRMKEVTPESHHVTAVTPEMSHHVTQAEAEAEADAKHPSTRVVTRSLREELMDSLSNILSDTEMQRNAGMWRQRINECPQAVAFALEDYKIRTPDQRMQIRNLPAWLTDRHKRALKDLHILQ